MGSKDLREEHSYQISVSASKLKVLQLNPKKVLGSGISQKSNLDNFHGTKLSSQQGEGWDIQPEVYRIPNPPHQNNRLYSSFLTPSTLASSNRVLATNSSCHLISEALYFPSAASWMALMNMVDLMMDLMGGTWLIKLLILDLSFSHPC
ncbi:hypothetical protein DSO57_1012078 [Entomophthora muscae]|uniref:Uncharacterized protein n=1 Tax=Entomophthora muscae TaxID=34485 RepID=A0ACC2TTN4_9FUNG|nr:hypothetical protein DSO57_1012078 [Entomophthora muscae]